MGATRLLTAKILTAARAPVFDKLSGRGGNGIQAFSLNAGIALRGDHTVIFRIQPTISVFTLTHIAIRLSVRTKLGRYLFMGVAV